MASTLFRLTLSLLLWCNVCTVLARIQLDTFAEDFNTYIKVGEKTPRLTETLNGIRLRTPLKFSTTNYDAQIMDGKQGSPKIALSCGLCKTVVATMFGWVENGDSRDEIVRKVVNLCTTLNLSTENVCRGLVESNIDALLFIYHNRDVTPATACGFALFPDCPIEDPEYEWSIDLSFAGSKPFVVEPKLPEDGAPTFSVLQLTDLHVDPNYTPGGNAACDEPACCRSDQGPPANDSAAAGYWGDYRDCDLPLHAFSDLLHHAASQHPDVAYVMFTGDIIDHGKWATSKEYNIELFNTVMGEIREVFDDTLVIPVLGNHEPHPLNVFSNSGDPSIPGNLSTSWLYELAADVWSTWIPDSRDTILRGGYYSVQVQPQLFVIVLNNNFCYNANFWLIYDNKDPTGELLWLAEQLLEAELRGAKVHILGHIPSGSDSCLSTWSREYRRIIDRFENTIAAQFHGHTHNDHFFVYYDPQYLRRATTVAYVGGSGTAYSYLNPNYRIYTVDGAYQGSSHQVLDHETWTYNLTEANLAGPDVKPVWKKLYSFKEAYEVSSMLPRDMGELVKSMATDKSILQKYFRFYVKEGDAALEKGCDDECLDSLLCEIVTTVIGDNTKCEELIPPNRFVLD